MKLIIERISEIRSAQRSNSSAVAIECDMTEGQMYDAVLSFLGRISDETWTTWCQEIAGQDHPFAGVDTKSQLHAMCVCMAARLDDCAWKLEVQAEICRQLGYYDGATAAMQTAREAREVIKQWEEL